MIVPRSSSNLDGARDRRREAMSLTRRALAVGPIAVGATWSFMWTATWLESYGPVQISAGTLSSTRGAHTVDIPMG
jgi:hypothetical protein